MPRLTGRPEDGMVTVMGFRFRHRVRLCPGFWVNLSKSRGSLSLGGRGATLNIGLRGTWTTVGVPGSGLSWRSPTRLWHHRDRLPGWEHGTAPAKRGRPVLLAFVCTIIVALAIVAWQALGG